MQIGQSLSVPFRDKEWVSKVILGGVFTILSMVIVGAFIVAGYLLRYLRQLLSGEELPLPDWDVGAMLKEGVEPVLVGFIYFIPVLIIRLIEAFFAAVVDSTLISLFLGLGRFLIQLALSIALPAALLRLAITGRWQSALDIQVIIDFIRENAGTYLLTWLVGVLLYGIIGSIGLLACGVGFFFTYFYSLLATVHIFAGMYRSTSGFKDL